MGKFERLMVLAHAVDKAETPGQKYQSRWELMEFINETNGLELYLSISFSLQRIEPFLTEAEKSEIRKSGVSFPEDWDKPKEMFKNG